MPRSFVHREYQPSDPAFLRDERNFLNRQWATLHLMEHERDQLARDLERARSLAAAAGIPKRAARREHQKLLAVIGVGDRRRQDDAAGLEVARRLRLAHPPGVVVMERRGGPASLIEAWSDADEALVIDAVSSGSAPGTIHRYEVNGESLPAELFRSESHGQGLADAVEVARELDGLPPRLVVYAIEGESFEPGEGLTPAIQEVVARLVMDLYGELSGAS